MVDFHGRFVWYELTTTDVGAAKAFYAKVMGWGAKDVAMPGMTYILFTVAGASIAGLTNLPEDARKKGATPGWIGYVDVDDVDVAADRTKQFGGAVHVPPTDVPNVSRFSVIADPQMATIALIKWLHPKQEQAAAPGKSGRVGWHELFAANCEKALAFYGELFGWQKAEADTSTTGIYQQFATGGRTIGGMFTKPPTVPVSFWLYYFNADDVDAAVERVKAGGGQILEGPMEVPGGSRVARCADPQGAMFALTGIRRDKSIGYFARSASNSR
jgi:predicted enzyme related to lactoylglutathione lyase